MAKQVDRAGRSLMIAGGAAVAFFGVVGALTASKGSRNWFHDKTEPNKDKPSISTPDTRSPVASPEVKTQTTPPSQELIPEGTLCAPIKETTNLQCGEVTVFVDVPAMKQINTLRITIGGTDYIMVRRNGELIKLTGVPSCPEIRLKTDSQGQVSGGCLERR